MVTHIRDLWLLLQDSTRPSTRRQRAAIGVLLFCAFVALAVRPA